MARDDINRKKLPDYSRAFTPFSNPMLRYSELDAEACKVQLVSLIGEDGNIVHTGSVFNVNRTDGQHRGSTVTDHQEFKETRITGSNPHKIPHKCAPQVSISTNSPYNTGLFFSGTVGKFFDESIFAGSTVTEKATAKIKIKSTATKANLNAGVLKVVDSSGTVLTLTFDNSIANGTSGKIGLLNADNVKTIANRIITSINNDGYTGSAFNITATLSSQLAADTVEQIIKLETTTAGGAGVARVDNTNATTLSHTEITKKFTGNELTKKKFKIGSFQRSSPLTASHQCVVVTGSSVDMSLYRATESGRMGPSSFTLAGWFKFANDGVKQNGRTFFRLAMAQSEFAGSYIDRKLATTSLFNTGSTPQDSAIAQITIAQNTTIADLRDNLHEGKFSIRGSTIGGLGGLFHFTFDKTADHNITDNAMRNKIGIQNAADLAQLVGFVTQSITAKGFHYADADSNGFPAAPATSVGVFTVTGSTLGVIHIGQNQAGHIGYHGNHGGQIGMTGSFGNGAHTYFTASNFGTVASTVLSASNITGNPVFGAFHRTASYGAAVGSTSPTQASVLQTQFGASSGSIAPYRFEIYHDKSNRISVNFLSNNQNPRVLRYENIGNKLSLSNLSNNWFHIAVVFDREKHIASQASGGVSPAKAATRLYLDGKELTVVTASGGAIGDFGTQPMNLFVGGPDIDKTGLSFAHAGFWNRALDKNAVRALYEAKNGVSFSKKSGKLNLPPKVQMAELEDARWNSKLRRRGKTPDAFFENTTSFRFEESFSKIDLDFSDFDFSEGNEVIDKLTLIITSSHVTGSSTVDKLTKFRPTRRNKGSDYWYKSNGERVLVQNRLQRTYPERLGVIRREGDTRSSISRIIGRHAIGAIKIKDGLATADNGFQIAITSSHGMAPNGSRHYSAVIKKYIFTKDAGFTTGQTMSNSGSNKHPNTPNGDPVVVKYTSAMTAAQIVDQFIVAINSANGHNAGSPNSVFTIAESSSGTKLYLAQVASGSAGNTPITLINSGAVSFAAHAGKSDFSRGNDTEIFHVGVAPPVQKKTQDGSVSFDFTTSEEATKVEHFVAQLARAINMSRLSMKAMPVSKLGEGELVGPNKVLRIVSNKPHDLSDKFRVQFINKREPVFPKITGGIPATGSILEMTKHTIPSVAGKDYFAQFRFSKASATSGSFIYGINRTINSEADLKYLPVIDRSLPTLSGSGIMRAGTMAMFESKSVSFVEPYNEDDHDVSFGFNQLSPFKILTASFTSGNKPFTAYHSHSFAVDPKTSIEMHRDSRLFMTGTTATSNLSRLGPNNSLKLSSQDHIVIDLHVTKENFYQSALANPASSEATGSGWAGYNDSTHDDYRFNGYNHPMGYFNAKAGQWRGVGRGLNHGQVLNEWKLMAQSDDNKAASGSLADQTKFYLDQVYLGFGQSTANLQSTNAGFQQGIDDFQTGKAYMRETGIAPVIDTFGFPSHPKFALDDDECIPVSSSLKSDNFLLESAFLEFTASLEFGSAGALVLRSDTSGDKYSAGLTFFLLNQRKADLSEEIEDEALKSLFGGNNAAVSVILAENPFDNIAPKAPALGVANNPISYKVQIPSDVIVTSSHTAGADADASLAFVINNHTKRVDTIRDLVAYSRVGFGSSNTFNFQNKAFQKNVKRPYEFFDMHITSSDPTDTPDGNSDINVPSDGLKPVAFQISGFIPLIPRSPGLGPGFSDFGLTFPRDTAIPPTNAPSPSFPGYALLRQSKGSRNGLGIPTGRSVFGGEFSGVERDYNTVSFSRTALLVSPEDLDQEVPYLLKKSDKLVLGIQLPLGFQQSGEPSFAKATSIRFKPQTMRLHMFGGSVRNNTLTSLSLDDDKDLIYTDAMHDVVGFDPIFDQFDTEPNYAQNGSYLDNIVSGSMLSSDVLSSNSISAGRKVVAKFTEAGGWVTSSFPRNPRIESDEIYFDSLVPNFAEMFNQINANVLGIDITDSNLTGETAGGGSAPKLGVFDIFKNDLSTMSTAQTEGFVPQNFTSKQFVIAIHSPRIPTLSTTISGSAKTFMSPSIRDNTPIDAVDKNKATGFYAGAMNKNDGSPASVGVAHLTCSDGDLVTNFASGLRAGQKITITSTDRTVKDYFISNTNSTSTALISTAVSGTAEHGSAAGQTISITSTDGTTKTYVLADPAMSDSDTTASTHTPLVANQILGTNTTVSGTLAVVNNAIQTSVITNTDTFVFTVPTTANGTGNAITVNIRDALPGASNDTITILSSSFNQATVVKMINGVADAGIEFASAGGNNGGLVGTGINGITATATGADAGKVKLTLDRPGNHTVSVTNSSGVAVENPGATYFTNKGGSITHGTIDHVAIMLTGNQATILNAIRTAILDANGHTVSKISLSSALTPAASVQSHTLTQAVNGANSLRTITNSIAAISGSSISFTGHVAHTAEVKEGDKLDGSTSSGSEIASLTSGATGVAVALDVTTGVTQAALLGLLRASIIGAAGHGSKLIVGSAPAETDGVKTMQVQQSAIGALGNTKITNDISGIVTSVEEAGVADIFRGGSAARAPLEAKPLHFAGNSTSAPVTYYTDAIKPGICDNWYTCFPFEPKFSKLQRVTSMLSNDDFKMTQADFVPNTHPSGTIVNKLATAPKKSPNLLVFASPFLYPPIVEHLYHIPRQFSEMVKGRATEQEMGRLGRLYSQKMVVMTSPYLSVKGAPGFDSGITNGVSGDDQKRLAKKYFDEVYGNANLKGGNLERWNRVLFGFGDIPGGIPRSLSTPGFVNAVTQSNGSLSYIGAPADSQFHPDSIDFYRGSELRGLRYGLINYKRQGSTAVFRRDRYGQFRDMLEQRLDSRMFIAGDVEDRAPVFVKFISRADLETGFRTETTPADTNSSNLSSFATSSLPYFDGQHRDRTDQEPDIRQVLEVFVD